MFQVASGIKSKYEFHHPTSRSTILLPVQWRMAHTPEQPWFTVTYTVRSPIEQRRNTGSNAR